MKEAAHSLPAGHSAHSVCPARVLKPAEGCLLVGTVLSIACGPMYSQCVVLSIPPARPAAQEEDGDVALEKCWG